MPGADIPKKAKFTFTPQVQPLSGGSDFKPGYGQVWEVQYFKDINAPSEAYPNPPVVGSTWSLTMMTVDMQRTTVVGGDVGVTDVADMDPSFCFTYRDKEYILSRSRTHFSEISNPMVWMGPDALGAGHVDMDNQTEVPENLVSIASFQGRLVFFARRVIQMWQVAAAPGAWVMQQAILNTGALAKDSVRSTGEIDVLYLADTGISSLRAREITGNAYVDDLGAAIGSLVRDKLANEPNRGPEACAVVEPNTGQYWLFLADTIFVLSYFPSSKVLAWSLYDPIDSERELFRPKKFVVYKGQVFCRGGRPVEGGLEEDFVFAFGGEGGQVYDGTKVTVETPWMDLKTPDKIKQTEGINVAHKGWWKIYGSTDVEAEVIGPLPLWDAQMDHTYDQGLVPFISAGTHVKFRMVSEWEGPAVFSGIVLTYNTLP